MTESFNFSKDWYYWGQNRLGSFLPLVGHLIYLLGFSAFNAAGIAQLIIIAAIAFFLWRLVKDGFWFLVALSLLLFPIYPFWMQLSLGHPYLAQFFFILFAFWLFFSNNIRDSIRYGFSPLLLMLGIWSSELTVAAALALCIINIKTISKAFRSYWYLMILSLGLGIKMFLEFKRRSVKDEKYEELLAGFSDFGESLFNQFGQLKFLLDFNGSKVLNSAIAALIILLLLFNIVGTIKFKRKPSPLVKTLLLSTIFSILIIHASAWSHLMGMPHRYFTMPYFLGVLGLIFWTKDLWEGAIVKYSLGIGLAVLIIFASISFNSKFETGAVNRIRVEEAKAMISNVFVENPQVESFTIIGSYWNTHLLDALSDKVVALPFKGEHLRNMDLIEKADQNEHFILIANGWLSDFPDQILEREWLLEKVGRPKRIDEILYCRYRKIKSYPKP